MFLYSSCTSLLLSACPYHDNSFIITVVSIYRTSGAGIVVWLCQVLMILPLQAVDTVIVTAMVSP